MKFKYIGAFPVIETKEDGKPKVIKQSVACRGYEFSEGEFTDVSDKDTIERLKGNPYFEGAKQGRPAKAADENAA